MLTVIAMAVFVVGVLWIDNIPVKKFQMLAADAILSMMVFVIGAGMLIGCAIANMLEGLR